MMHRQSNEPPGPIIYEHMSSYIPVVVINKSLVLIKTQFVVIKNNERIK